ncbi:MAG: efflux RND transporter periplasmic adaptor subunit [Proteobacteria bacterium]|nr:efflux RND transporter periplasmic adaptor subunit [Pseudomonadota bacterium]
MKQLFRQLKQRSIATRAIAIVLGIVVSILVLYWVVSMGEAPSKERKLLYYKNPMGTGHVSDKPMKDQMGMDYIPVYENDLAPGARGEPGLIVIEPAMVQTIGVRTAKVGKGKVAGEISASGVVALNEAMSTIVTSKIAGYIEKLHVTAVGQNVTQESPLFDLYSPDLDALLQEYLSALRYQSSLPANANAALHRNATELAVATQMRLESLGVRKTQMKRMAAEGGVPRLVTIYSPQSGTVLKKNVNEGGFVPAGTELFVLADLSELWVLADVYTQDYAALRAGSRAQVDVQGLPEKTFEGQVDFIYPTVDAQTRVAKVRIVLPNPRRLLRPDMFAQVKIQGASQTQLMLPKSAVLRSGTRDWVILALGEGRFRPQAVKLGSESGEHYAVLSGVKEGETVVASAQFLLDSESRLQEALHKLASEAVEPK